MYYAMLEGDRGTGGTAGGNVPGTAFEFSRFVTWVNPVRDLLFCLLRISISSFVPKWPLSFSPIPSPPP